MARKEDEPFVPGGMKELLARTTEQLNEADRLRQANEAANPLPNDLLGDGYAMRYREAADKVAKAVEEQAQERLKVAQASVKDAEEHLEKAQKIAADIRAGAEDEAKRAILNARRLQESIDTIVALRTKFEQEPMP